MRIRLHAPRCDILRHDCRSLSQLQIECNPVCLRNRRICQREIQRVATDVVIGRQHAVRYEEDLVVSTHVRRDTDESTKSIRDAVASVTDWQIQGIISISQNRHIVARTVEQQIVARTSKEYNLQTAICDARRIQHVIAREAQHDHRRNSGRKVAVLYVQDIVAESAINQSRSPFITDSAVIVGHVSRNDDWNCKQSRARGPGTARRQRDFDFERTVVCERQWQTALSDRPDIAEIRLIGSADINSDSAEDRVRRRGIDDRDHSQRRTLIQYSHGRRGGHHAAAIIH